MKYMRLVSISIVLLLLAAPATVADDAEVAGRFARLFMAGDHKAFDGMMTGAMKDAMGPDRVRQLLEMLGARHGKVEKVGTAWEEDVLQGYRRFRVPVMFERNEIDLRIVLDAKSLVAGLFFVAHVPPPSERVEAVAPVKEIEVAVGDGDGALPGTLSIPDGEGPFPGVVLVHGSGPNDRDETVGANKPFRDIAWGLAERGIAVLRYDKRSFARPKTLAVVGDALTVREEVVVDARAALDVLRKHPGVDAGKVFVLGHSLGGMLAPRIARAEPHPAGMVVLAGATLPLPEKMLEQVRYMSSLDGGINEEEQSSLDDLEGQVRTIRSALDGETEDPEGSILGAPVGYFRDLEVHAPADLAARLSLPVLVLQGKRDYQVTLKDFALWEKALEGKPFACLQTYDSLDHLFRPGEGPAGPHDYDRMEPVSPRVIEDVAAWIHTGKCP